MTVAAADFVQAVEPVRTRGATHDTAVPAFDAVAGRFAGHVGASVPVGVLGTGLNVRHLDIGTGRRSICGANFMPLFEARTQDQDLWVDADGHGTHMTGTLPDSVPTARCCVGSTSSGGRRTTMVRQSRTY